MSRVPVDFNIVGDVVQLEQLANSLDGPLLDQLQRCQAGLSATEINFEPSWRGDAARAFVESTLGLESEIRAHISPYIARAGEVIRAYAWRLRRGSDVFAGYAQSAAEHEMAVSGTHIHPPEVVKGSASENLKFELAQSLFDEITERIGQWHEENRIWVVENFSSLLTDAAVPGSIANLLTHFQETEPGLYSTALDAASLHADARVEFLKESYGNQAEAYQEYKEGLRSGNPALKDAAEKISGRELRSGLSSVEIALNNWSQATTALHGAASAALVVETVIELRTDPSFTHAAAGAAGGAGGAFALAKAFSKGGLPGFIIGSAAGGFLGTGAGKAAWESMVPLGIREEADAWFTNPGALSVNNPTL